MRVIETSSTANTATTINNNTVKSSISNNNELDKPLCEAVFILEPQLIETANIDHSVKLSNEYGKSSACVDLQNVLIKMGYQQVEICPINLNNYKQVILEFVELQSKQQKSICVFNLCDGCETDGYPGQSILQELDNQRIPYTGATPLFYKITTSKPELKRYLIQNQVKTSDFVEITSETTEQDINALGYYPLIVKPSISYASISITDKSIVHNAKQALEQAKAVRGVSDGVFVEKYLEGREFTAFVTGSKEEGVTVYQVAERVFNPQLGKYQRILAFDRYWQGYDLDGSVPDNPQSVYWYAQAAEEVQPLLKDLAGRAYLAVQGSGYGRVDIRTNGLESKEAYVLEVNANCGVSFNFNEFTSTTGEILRMSGERNTKFANDLIRFALNRSQKK